MATAKNRDAMEVADWISNRDALLNSYHDIEKMAGEITDLEERVQHIQQEFDKQQPTKPAR